MNKNAKFIGKIIVISAAIIFTIMILLMVAGCKGPGEIIGDKVDDAGEAALDKGKAALDKTTDKVKSVTATKEESDILDKMTNKWIILITTVSGIVFFCFAGFAMYRMKPILAASLGATGLAVIAIPVLIVIMWKAAIFLLYVFYAIVIVGLAVGVFILWRKLEKKDKVGHSFVSFMTMAKEQVDVETWKKLKAIADEVKDDEALKELNTMRTKQKV